MKPIIVYKEINCNVNLVWQAVTVRSKMIQWFFDNIPDFKAVVGFKTWFIVKNEDRLFYHLWEVVEVEQYKTIKVEWTYPDYVKDSFLVTFELNALSENKTEFKVIVEGIEKLSHVNVIEFKRESCIGGWEYFSESLKRYLEE